MDPSNWNSCPAVRKVICGRAWGGKGSTTTMMISMSCFPHRNMRPAKRGSDRSKSTVCRMADASWLAIRPDAPHETPGGTCGVCLSTRAGVSADGRRVIGRCVAIHPMEFNRRPGIAEKVDCQNKKKPKSPTDRPIDLKRGTAAGNSEMRTVAQSSEKAYSLFCRILAKASRFLHIKTVTWFNGPGLFMRARLEKAPI